MIENLKNLDKKTLVYAGLVGVGILVVFIVIAVVINLITPKYYEYSEVEELMSEAAEKYYNDNSNYLPNENGLSSTVSVATLVSGEYIKPLEELMKDSVNCSGKIIVTNYNGEYSYAPYLDCPDYKTLELYKIITDSKNIVTEGRGLYHENGEYSYKGEVNTNYVKINNNLWRIVKVDKNNNILLTSEFKTERELWDNRYNSERRKSTGINDYNVSRIKDSLLYVYAGETLFKESDKNKIISKEWCIGKRSPNDKSKDNSTECKVTSSEKLPIGLLTVSEVINASLDKNCASSISPACVNYNYLSSFDGSYYTITPGTENTSSIYFVQGVPTESYASIKRYLRFAVYLDTKALYDSGTGRASDPYIIR